jgi:hypothetical protein
VKDSRNSDWGDSSILCTDVSVGAHCRCLRESWGRLFMSFGGIYRGQIPVFTIVILSVIINIIVSS